MKIPTLWQNHPYLYPYFQTNKIIIDIVDNYYENEPLEYFNNIQFWKAIKYEKILIFQRDSVLCSKSKYRVEDFLEYDYVGAPWLVKDTQFNGRVGNGGLSLRSKSVMIQLLTMYPQKEQLEEFRKLNEDCYLNKFIALLPGVHLPRYLTAKRFAIEMDWHGLYGKNIAAGIHRHHFKDHKDWNSLFDRCAELNFTRKRVKFGYQPNLNW